MLEKGKINASEFKVIVIVFTIGASILTVPAPLAKLAKQDAWITSILTVLISLIFIFVYNHLIELYPSKTYIECHEEILGNWIGRIVVLLFLFYLYYLTSGLLREIGSFFTTHILVETPIQMIMILFLLTSLFGVRLGIEVIVRTAIIFIPWVIVLLILLFLFLIPEIKLENIQPKFGEGIKPIINGTYKNLALPYLQLVILLMLTPYVNDKREMKKAFYIGTLFGGLSLSLLIIFSILILGADIGARQSYPVYTLGKKISIGGFLERIEVIVAIIWILTVYFKLTICFYGLTNGLAQLFRLKSYQILTFPLGFLIIAFSLISHPDVVHFQNFIAKTWTPFSLTICFFLPLLLVVIGKIRKKASLSKIKTS